jgi:hypothetical protein
MLDVDAIETRKYLANFRRQGETRRSNGTTAPGIYTTGGFLKQ